MNLNKDETNIFMAAMPISADQEIVIKKLRQHENSLLSELDLKWTIKSDLHITLGYLRQIAIEHIEPVLQKFEEIEDYKSIQAQVSGAKVYGTALVLTLEPQSVFLNMHQSLSQSLNQLFEESIKFDQNKSFQAHMTIGRIQSKNGKVPTHHKDSLAKWAKDVFHNFSFTIIEVNMLHREPKTDKIYECLRRYPLKA